MEYSKQEREFLIQELSIELNAKLDGSGKNLVASVCPYCGHTGGKFGVYVGKETDRKKTFMSHCFSCGHSNRTLEQLLKDINREDLILTPTFDFNELNDTEDELFSLEEEDEIDDSLSIVELPDDYKRCFKNRYLKTRGFNYDDYEYFPVGTTRGLNFKFDNYVIFPIIDGGDIVGYVSRHTWSKQDIDEYNAKARRNGKFQIMRYKNSVENDFVKLLYNYDSVVEDETDTVILVEGVFDCIALTRKLELYDNHRIAICATFGKKISNIQIFKLQSKGVRTIVIGYDGDAVAAIQKTAEELNEYFDVYIADIENPTQDFDSMDFWEIYDTLADNLKTPIEYKLNKIQL